MGEAGDPHRRRADGDDGLVEADPHTPLAGFHGDPVRRLEAPAALDDPDVTRLGQTRQPARQLLHHLVLTRPQLIQIDIRLAETHTQVRHPRRLVDDLGGVEQGLGGNATHIEADAAQTRVAFDQDHLFPQVGGTEGRRVAAGARAQHHHLGGDLGGGGLPRRLGVQDQEEIALRHPVARLDLDAGQGTRGRRRNPNGPLVALQRDQGLILQHPVAGGDRDLDDRDPPADRGHANLNLVAHLLYYPHDFGGGQTASSQARPHDTRSGPRAGRPRMWRRATKRPASACQRREIGVRMSPPRVNPRQVLALRLGIVL